MTDHLSLAEEERLFVLVEECAEVIVAVNKILRHGYESYNPHDTDAGSNREQLMSELGDVEFAKDLMLEADDISIDTITTQTEIARERKQEYLHYNKD